jgi:CRISPR/Cas system-associated exonuclease Cas4 (RecB family)
MQCGYKYYLSRIKHLKPFIPINYSLVTGVAFHSLANRMYEEADFSREFLVRNWKQEFLHALDEQACTFVSTAGYEDHLSDGYRLVSQFYKFAKANELLAKPVATEWSFTVDYDDFQITGIIDLIIQRQGSYQVIDFKSGWKVPTQQAVDEHVQLTLYHWAVSNHFSFVVDKVGLYFPRKGKIMESVRSAEHHKVVLGNLTKAVRQIQAGEFEPNFDSCPNCDYKSCCDKFKDEGTF